MAPDATAATIAAITTVMVAGYSLPGLPHRTQTPALHILPFTYWFSELPGQALSSACLPMAASSDDEVGEEAWREHELEAEEKARNSVRLGNRSYAYFVPQRICA